MKTWKLVAGVLSIILFGLVAFQSCAAGLGNTLAENGEVGGSAGIIVAVFLLAGGIVSIASRKGKGPGSDIALIVMFGLASLIGFAMAGSYKDLKIWSAWCLINVVLAIVSVVNKNKNKGEKAHEE